MDEVEETFEILLHTFSSATSHFSERTWKDISIIVLVSIVGGSISVQPLECEARGNLSLQAIFAPQAQWLRIAQRKKLCINNHLIIKNRLHLIRLVNSPFTLYQFESHHISMSDIIINLVYFTHFIFRFSPLWLSLQIIIY